MMYVDPRVMFSVDPSAKPFMRAFRADLLDPTIQNDPSQGKVVVGRMSAPPNQVLVVKDLVYYVQQRYDVGLATENYRTVAPALVEGQVAFEPLVNGNSPLVVDSDENAASTAAAALAGGTNAVRAVINGVTSVTDTPYKDARAAWANWLFAFEVPPGGTLAVVFSLMPTNGAAPEPGVFAIGGAGNRLDFAGCIVSGVSMPAHAYAEFQNRVDDARRAR